MPSCLNKPWETVHIDGSSDFLICSICKGMQLIGVIIEHENNKDNCAGIYSGNTECE